MWWLALACSLESLSIVLPPRGIESIQQEDLRRDIWSLEIEEKPIDDWWNNRAKQLHLEPALRGRETTCHGRSTESDTGIVFWTERESVYRNSAIAALLSLAKSTDATSSPVGLMYCVGRPPKFGLGWSEQKIESIAGPNVVEVEGVWTSNTTPELLFVDLNFEHLEQNIRHIATVRTPYLLSDPSANP